MEQQQQRQQGQQRRQRQRAPERQLRRTTKPLHWSPLQPQWRVTKMKRRGVERGSIASRNQTSRAVEEQDGWGGGTGIVHKSDNSAVSDRPLGAASIASVCTVGDLKNACNGALLRALIHSFRSLVQRREDLIARRDSAELFVCSRGPQTLLQ